MRTYLAETPEEGLGLVAVGWDPASDGLDPLDRLILELDLSGCRPGRIQALLAPRTAVSLPTIYLRQKKASYVAVRTRIETAHMERIARGEFGAIAIAKAELVGNMRRLQGMARGAEDERVRHKALVDMIKFAGFAPPTPLVTENPERVIDAMSAAEAEHFAETGEFPAHLADQLARVGTAQLKKREAERWVPKIEELGEEEDPRVPPERAVAREVEEDA